MRIKRATRRYEAWLGEHTPLVEADLAAKHRLMSDALFPFMRATFYRWAQLYPQVCPDLAQAPRVLAVGDLHVENFGTWRDVEGRLIWGINDFDEAYPLPYTNDLVRLALSAQLAIEAGHLQLGISEACAAVLEGYREGLAAGGTPFVLAEKHEWLRRMALNDLRDPIHFWARFAPAPAVESEIPPGAHRAIDSVLPEPGLPYRAVPRVAGLGSLGRQRWVALAEWRGGQIAREVKGLAPSACAWALESECGTPLYAEILVAAVRCPDPVLRVRRHWLARRLAPDCSRVELAELPRERDELRLLHAMGWETANVHLGSSTAVPVVRRDLDIRPAGWLESAAHAMAHALKRDWEEWKRAEPE